jgi:hypothetical protein
MFAVRLRILFRYMYVLIIFLIIINLILILCEMYLTILSLYSMVLRDWHRNDRFQNDYKNNKLIVKLMRAYSYMPNGLPELLKTYLSTLITDAKARIILRSL